MQQIYTRKPMLKYDLLNLQFDMDALLQICCLFLKHPSLRNMYIPTFVFLTLNLLYIIFIDMSRFLLLKISNCNAVVSCGTDIFFDMIMLHTYFFDMIM